MPTNLIFSNSAQLKLPFDMEYVLQGIAAARTLPAGSHPLTSSSTYTIPDGYMIAPAPTGLGYGGVKKGTEVVFNSEDIVSVWEA